MEMHSLHTPFEKQGWFTRRRSPVTDFQSRPRRLAGQIQAMYQTMALSPQRSVSVLPTSTSCPRVLCLNLLPTKQQRAFCLIVIFAPDFSIQSVQSECLA